MKKQINQKTKFPMLAALLCIVLLIASVFLPYFTAMDEYKELLELAEQDLSLSLFDFSQMFLEEEDDSFVRILYIIFGLSALTAVFSIMRKPILVIICDILTTALMTLTYITFTVDSMPYYDLGISSTLIFAACAGLFVSAIWMMVAKTCAKKKYATTHEQTA